VPTQFPISRQGLQDIALFLIAGLVIFAVLAFVARRRGANPRRQVTAAGILGGLAILCYGIAFSGIAPNVPTPPVPLTARFQRNPVPETAESIDAGRQLFQMNCAICHGARGLGDGPAAFTLNPRPVNLQLHVPQHAEGEIYYWISEGVAGTGMPAWKDKLTDEQRWQIVRYLQALAAGRAQ
jgi:mono/diheme cytochrome c family protein